jgi:hypothetical protein
MAIPPLNEHGWLPEGIHDCTLEEAAARFGGFQHSDRRPQLWAQFLGFVREAQASKMIKAIIVDGSFVTAEPAPNDIDLVLVMFARHDFSVDLPPSHYNVLSQRRVRQRFGFDIVVVTNELETLNQAVAFFQQVRQRPTAKKGLLRIRI